MKSKLTAHSGHTDQKQDRHSAGYYRRHKLKKRYDLTPEDYDRLLSVQSGLCGICGRLLAGSPERRAHVDHDHKTGQVRGLLCPKCNLGLGLFSDNQRRLELASQYLGRAAKAARSAPS